MNTTITQKEMTIDEATKILTTFIMSGKRLSDLPTQRSNDLVMAEIQNIFR